MKKTTLMIMKKSSVLVFLILSLLTSCGGDGDPTGKFWWTLIGFPLLGVAYIIGGIVMSIFQSKENKSEPEPLPAIIVGVIVMFVIYSIIKAM